MNRNEKPIDVAIIGCGRIAGHHSRSIQKVRGVRLAAVCDLVEAKATAYSKECGVPMFTNYRTMLRDLPQIDVVAIVTPSGMHAEHAMEMLTEYKKHVIVEKPTFMKPSQVNAAFDAAEKNGLTIFPVFQNRHNLAVRSVLRGIASGELGKIRICSVRVRWCRPQRYYDLAPWRGTFAQDGGALTNQGVHHIDLMRQFGGEVAQVSSTMCTLGAKIEVEDAAVAIVRYESGAIGALEITTAARPDDFEASISVVCENGLAQIGGIAVNELQIYTPDPTACAPNSEDFSGNVYGHGHEKIYQEIAAHFLEKRAFSVSRDDCLRTIRLLDAFYRADESSGWVSPKSSGESTRLGRADEKLARLYRTPRLQVDET